MEFGVVFPAVLLEQLAELVEQLFGLLPVIELVMGQGQERAVGRVGLEFRLQPVCFTA